MSIEGYRRFHKGQPLFGEVVEHGGTPTHRIKITKLWQENFCFSKLVSRRVNLLSGPSTVLRFSSFLFVAKEVLDFGCVIVLRLLITAAKLEG